MGWFAKERLREKWRENRRTGGRDRGLEEGEQRQHGDERRESKEASNCGFLAAHSKALSIQCDVAKAEEVDAMVQFAVEKFGAHANLTDELKKSSTSILVPPHLQSKTKTIKQTKF